MFKNSGHIIPSVFLMAFAVFCFPDVLLANAGDLDPTFDFDGKVITDFAGELDTAFDISIQPDGKVIVVGLVFSAGKANFGLVRYNEDGSIDSSFGVGGKVSTGITAGHDYAAAVVLQSDGKIIAAGVANADTIQADFALARYNPDGSLDTSFGTNGKLATDFAADGDGALSVVLQPDGRIVAAGSTFSNGQYDFALARYNTNGTLDTNFGNNGKVTTDFLGGHDYISAVVRQLDGKFVCVGSTSNTSDDFGLVRYNEDGSLDATFGTGGKVTTDFFASDDRASSAAIQSDGKIIVAGESAIGTINDFALARYNTNGSSDSTFGSNGKVTTDFFGEPDAALSVILQSNNKIIAAGYAVSTNPDFVIARYNNDGILDTSFGTGGKVTTDFLSGSEGIYQVVAQSDGKFIAVGATSIGNDTDFALARYEGDPPPPCIFCDDFEDGILASDWNYVKPLWSEILGMLTGTPSGKKAEAIADPVFQGCSLCSIQATISTAGGFGNKVWLLGWYQDKQNTIELLMKEESDRWIIKQRAGGIIVSKVKVLAPIVPDIFYDVQISFDGSDFVLNVNGTTLTTVPASIIPNGTIGFRVKNTMGRFGFVAVQ